MPYAIRKTWTLRGLLIADTTPLLQVAINAGRAYLLPGGTARLYANDEATILRQMQSWIETQSLGQAAALTERAWGR